MAGLENSLLFTNTATEKITQPWFDDDWGQEVIQQKISRTYIENEDDALLKYPTNFQGGYSLVNKDSLNRWGIPRGYAIHAGYSPIHNVGCDYFRPLYCREADECMLRLAHRPLWGPSVF